MSILRIVNFVKNYFLQITAGIVSFCLLCVFAYSAMSGRRQKHYVVVLRAWGDSVRTDTLHAKGFPNLSRYRRKWELTDYDGVLYSTCDSVSIVGLRQE